VQLFLWLLIQDKITTRDFLFQHDYLTFQESRCAFCNKSLESSSHLFIHCHFIWNIWMKLLSNRAFCNFFQNLLMICATNGFPWLKASNRISHGSSFFYALFGIFSFTEMTLFLMTLP
jgi:hypothetical protein